MSILADQIETARSVGTLGVEGRVLAATGMTIQAVGLPVPVGSLCEVNAGFDRRILAEVIGFNRGVSLLMPLADAAGLTKGQSIHHVTSSQKVPVGPSILGRVVNALGEACDHGPAISVDAYYPLHRAAPAQTPAGKSVHYDVLRACVILSVSACVIATASGLGLPVSTTYVTFAAVVATGMADRIYQRGDAALKLGRTVWVVFSWFSAAVIAAVAAGLTCLVVYHIGTTGMALSLLANLIIRQILKTRGDAQEKRIRQEAEERFNPELFTEGYD